MHDRLTISVDEHIAQVRLDRPEKMNALDRPMLEAIARAGRELGAMRDLRAVVLSGAGAAFCAGLDVASFAAADEVVGDLVPRTHGRSNLFQHAAMLWRELPVPVIAAVHGVCFGGGLQIALGADVRIAAADSRISVMEIQWGIIPDMGAFVLADGLVRRDVLRELTYTGREIGGDEAVALGLMTRTAADPHAEATALAREIAARNPDAVVRAKAMFERLGDDPADVLIAESRLQMEIFARPNQREAVQARIERRAPRFAVPD